MKKAFITLVFFGIVLFVPRIAIGAFDGTKGLIGDIGSIIQLLTQIAFAAALLFFFWGMAKFILHAGDERGREEGKEVMKWGIVALFVIVSIWGIVAFIQDDLLPGGYSTAPNDFWNDNSPGAPLPDDTCLPGQRRC